MAPITALLLFFANWGADMPEVVVEVDIPYSSPSNPLPKNTLDIYQTPETIERADKDLTPVLLFIHGGGLLIGDKSDFALLGHKFASAGFTTAIANHRLSPDVSHPEHIRDIASAFAWVHENIEDYGGDPDRIFVAGHSSGGYLAMLLATDPQYLAAFGLGPEKIRGVVPISGFFYIERLAPERPASVWGEDAAAWRLASPASQALENTPPTLLLYAQHDNRARRLESNDFARQLRIDSTAEVGIQEMANRSHATIGIYLMAVEDATSDTMLVFMRRLSERHPARGIPLY
jgi:acetyl esterase/lipase